MVGMVELSVLAATPRRGAKGDDGWGRRGMLGGEGTVKNSGQKVESRCPSTLGSGILVLWQRSVV